MATITKYTPEINTLLNQVSATVSDVTALDGRVDTLETNIVDLTDQITNFQPSSFIASDIYNSTKSATTSVLGQSEGKASGAKTLRAENLSTTNECFIGLGQTNSEAEYNATHGINNINRFKLPISSGPCYINVANYTFYAWVSALGTANIHLVQGV